MRGLVAILCSGQGGQHPAMFDLVANCPAPEPIFAAAGVLGQDPRRFVGEAAPAELFSDLPGQILCCTQALAAWAALGTVRPARGDRRLQCRRARGLGCAGTLDGPGTLRLAQCRSALMDAAAHGARHIVSLRVAVASHTPLLREATEQFRAVLREACPESCRSAGAEAALELVPEPR